MWDAKKGGAMTAIPHEPSAGGRRTSWLWITELCVSLAISVIWLAVAIDALFGPNIDSSTPGGTTSSVPSAVAMALFATIATWAVAKYGFRAREQR
jgi:hypothetical protein